MKKINLKIILIILFLFCLPIFKTEAASIVLNYSKNPVNLHEQFYVDVLLEAQGESFNGIKGKINFSDGLKFIRAEEGKSLINYWVDSPTQEGNSVLFSGIMVNGFNGVIDPFDSSHKLPGIILRLVFEAQISGEMSLNISDFELNLNDGLGTIRKISDKSFSILVKNTENKVEYQPLKSTPEIMAYVIRDTEFFGNKYVLIFDARDAESGIMEVLIKEGKRNWVKAESPYILQDQTRRSRIIVQAKNYFGEVAVTGVEALPFKISIVEILGSFVLILAFFAIIKRIYEKKKQ